MPRKPKHTFLVVYDYGQGGVWAHVAARTVEEITDLYPELTVVLDRPQWLSDERLVELPRFDVEDTPSGLLAALVAQRAVDQGDQE